MLMVAVWVSNTNPNIVRLLVDAGADPNKQQGADYSPLMLVVANDEYDLATMMLKGRRLPAIKTDQLKSLYHAAGSARMKALLHTTLGAEPPPQR